MIYVVCALLAVIAGELGWLLKRTGSAGLSRPPEDGAPESGEFEKRWREGLDAMMGYDLLTARENGRRDTDDQR